MNNQEINQTEKLENTNIMPTNLQANSITPPNIIQTPSNNALEPIIPTQKAAEIAPPKSEIVNTKKCCINHYHSCRRRNPKKCN